LIELGNLFNELIAQFPLQDQLPLVALTVEDSEKYLKYLESDISYKRKFEKKDNEKLSKKLMVTVKKFEDKFGMTCSLLNPDLVKYSKNFEDSFDNISKKFREFKANPPSHPLYHYEWKYFYLKNPNLQNKTGIWQNHWLKRLNQLEEYEILKEKVSIRTRQGLPCEVEYESSLEKFEVEEAKKCMFLKEEQRIESKNKRDLSIDSTAKLHHQPTASSSSSLQSVSSSGSIYHSK
jgi:hypothetical protein